MLRDVTASACDHGYGLILSLIVFLFLKIEYTHIALSDKKIKPRHLCLLPPHFMRGRYSLMGT